MDTNLQATMADEEEYEVIPDEFLYDEYDMEAEPFQSTGLCVIFNSTTFSARCLPTRQGSEKDVKSIQKVFGDHFGFEVREVKDKTKIEMENYLREIASTFNHAWRCFVCFFLSHGLGEEYLADFDGKRVNVRLLVQLLDGENCPRMIGKPKLFFAQMCRGFDREEYDRTHGGYDAAGDELLPDALPANVSPDRDRLVCYATTEGRMALMDPEKGSIFIQTLTKVLRSIGDKKTIEEVLRVVTKIVDKGAEKQYKVCPVFDSTLVGKLIFRPRQKNLQAEMTVVTESEADAHKNEVLQDLMKNMQKLLV